MSNLNGSHTATSSDWIAWSIAVLLLVLTIKLHLLPALLAGLTVYSLVNLLVPRLSIAALNHERRRMLAVALIASLVIAVLTGIGLGVISFFRASEESLPALFGRMAEIIEQSRDKLPDWLLVSLPDDAEGLQQSVVEWLREHAKSLQTASAGALRGFAHALIGMVIGAMLALQSASGNGRLKPFTRAFNDRAARMSQVFRRVVFAQVWISAINTFLTWMYLGLVLPAFDIHLPLTKTLVALTFVVGLMPILGNVISNTVIFVVSLSQSLTLALVSIAYLVVIHKLEYFLNARIIGAHIRARAWELLLAMLFMEAAFGIAGLIIAPMAYSFFKDEFRDRGLL